MLGYNSWLLFMQKKKSHLAYLTTPHTFWRETFLFYQESKISDPHFLLKSAWSKANTLFHSPVLIPNHENPWRIKNYRFQYKLPLSPLKVIKEFTEASLYEAIKYCYGHNSFSEWSPHQTLCQNLTLLPFPTLKDGGRGSIPTSLNSFPQATSMRSSHYNHSPVSPIRDLLRCSFAMVISCISTDVSCARAHVCLLYPKILWMYVSSSVRPNFVHAVTHLS